MLIAFSGDPMYTVNPFLEMIDDLSKMITNIEPKINVRENELQNYSFDGNSDDYTVQLNTLNEALDKLGGLN